MIFNSLGLLSLLSHWSLQTVLGSKPPKTAGSYAQYHTVPCDDNLFTPVEDLSALSFDGFTALGHPSFPEYSVRMKKTVFECDPHATAYTGYIDIQTRHLFYIFFESRNDPATDDIVFWTSGGPGCSSSLGLFMENGPCTILQPGGPVYNPYSWTTNANMFWVDQPVNVGYSYADYNETVSTTEEASADIAAFITIFFENFSQFKGRAFHMAGESYAGHYLPIFAAQVYDRNAALAAAGKTKINLTSIMIGNGVVDYFSMIASHIDVQCTTLSGVSPPVSDIATCLRMKKALPLCEKWTRERCIEEFDTLGCSAATNFCEDKLSTPFLASGSNPYDITRGCEGDPAYHCYPIMQYVIEYLSNATIRELFGVSPKVPEAFQACSNGVFSAFSKTLDEYHETYTQVAQLLERNVRVLVYAGTYDWMCNWIGNERWTLKMSWTGQEAFASQPLRDWEVDGVVAGRTRSANGLTYATVDGAGHIVPYYKPRESLALVERWLANVPL